MVTGWTRQHKGRLPLQHTIDAIEPAVNRQQRHVEALGGDRRIGVKATAAPRR